MRAYSFSHVEGWENGSVLVFANTAREARKVGFASMGEEIADGEWVCGKVAWINDSPWLFEEADQAKLAAGIAHCIDNPKSCDHCERWGKPMAGPDICKDCQHDKEIDDAQRLRDQATGEAK